MAAGPDLQPDGAGVARGVTGPGLPITLQRDAGSTDWVGYLVIRVPPGREAHLGFHPSGRGMRWWLLLEPRALARFRYVARGLL